MTEAHTWVHEPTKSELHLSFSWEVLFIRYSIWQMDSNYNCMAMANRWKCPKCSHPLISKKDVFTAVPFNPRVVSFLWIWTHAEHTVLCKSFEPPLIFRHKIVFFFAINQNVAYVSAACIASLKKLRKLNKRRPKEEVAGLKKLSTVDEQFVKVKSLRNKKKVRAKTWHKT